MCGIYGYLSMGKHTPEMSEVASLAQAAEERGKDASGVAWADPAGDSKVWIYKSAVLASALMDNVVHEGWFGKQMPRLLVGHSRMATQGDPRQDVNNHPVYSKKTGTTLIHNGIIRNDVELFKEYSLLRVAEVDSEILLRLWDMGDATDEPEKRIDRIGEQADGPFACAVISSRRPGELVLFRNRNPICLAWDAEREIVWFASTPQILAGRFPLSGHRWGPLPLAGSVSLPENSYLILSVGKPTRFGKVPKLSGLAPGAGFSELEGWVQIGGFGRELERLDRFCDGLAGVSRLDGMSRPALPKNRQRMDHSFVSDRLRRERKNATREAWKKLWRESKKYEREQHETKGNKEGKAS